ncbi:MAG: hypothetical protein E7134_01760 [Rikenellaceae bacterium]|nr:hypothetical protein [Rikenellaceae bacterium]
MKKLMYLAAFAAFALASCQPAPEPEPIAPIFPDAPSKVEESLVANPEGNPAEAEDATLLLTLDIEAEGAWTLEAFEEYDWVEVTPTSGEGNATLTFVTLPNETDKERTAEFEIKETITATNAAEVDNGDPTTKEVVTYNIFLSQKRKESNVADSSLAFLKAIVEGNMLGEDTPAVDNWYVVDETFPGINMDYDSDNKLAIVSIDGAPLTDFPTVMNLPELYFINISNNANLAGKHLPAEWNTPKCYYICVNHSKLSGTIPAGLAETTPNLQICYLNNNHMYGALPHTWAAGANGGTGKLEILMIAEIYNRNSTPEEGFKNDQSDGLGYMIPATFDCRMNFLNSDGTYANNTEEAKAAGYYQGDKTCVKTGGVFQGNYIGFEKGWGQERYVAFGGGAEDDLSTWSIYRAQCAKGGWAWYYSNLGYVNEDETTMYFGVPQEMKDWDQGAADAYTASAEAIWGDVWKNY